MMRDMTRSEADVRAAIVAAQQAIDYALSKNLSVLNINTLRPFLRIVRGLYTLGESREACQPFLESMVQRYVDFVAGEEFRLAGFMEPDLYNEVFAGAYLADRIDAVFEALGRCTWKEPPNPLQYTLLDLSCQAFGGRCPETDKVPTKPPSIPKQIQALPSVLQTIASQDRASFPQSLSDYLMKHWGPGSERAAKDELRARSPSYTGKWSLFSAAACRNMGMVPSMPAKALSYFPRDLV